MGVSYPKKIRGILLSLNISLSAYILRPKGRSFCASLTKLQLDF
ncbi:hypothetical protein HPHPP62_0091 [Helicobacter pylori Hp P-62]|nr:hypothetical protein HPHPP62_0091 [Helicobacter pylori Hp P-62]